MNKKDGLGVLLDCQDSDIIVGTETWLTKNKQNNNEFIPDSYEVYRNDRADGYGGVLIAVKRASPPLELLQNLTISDMWPVGLTCLDPHHSL